MSADRRWTWRDVDLPLAAAALVLVAIGIAFVHSVRTSGDGLAILARRQVVFALAGLAGAGAMAWFGPRRLAGPAPWVFVVGLGGLLYTALFGVEVSGNRAWLRFGPMSVQPSEFMKVITLLLLARVAAAQPPGRPRLSGLLLLVAIAAAPVGLILMQHDAGTALTFVPMLLAVAFVGGLRWRWIVAGVLALAVAAPVGWSVLKPYQQARIRIVLDPDLDPQGVGYHAIQSRIAVGSGGVTGQGYLAGSQNRLDFLPERHTDYIFAVIAEEWGLLGCLLVLGLYLLVLRRVVDLGAVAGDRVAAFTCAGALALLATHLVINVGMVLGLMPTIGIPLPLVSYGGSSLVASLLLLGAVAGVRRDVEAPA